MLTANQLINLLLSVPDDAEVRIGDVSEGDDLHVSVGALVLRSQCVVLVPGDDDIWKDETLASEVLSQKLWPEEEADEN